MIVRPPAVSGRFYPADPDRLARDVDRLIAESAGDDPAPGARALGILVPHAGYVFSGTVAARAWSYVKDRDPDVVVLMGPDHFTGFPLVAVCAGGAYGTPLGAALVDQDLAEALVSAGRPIVERPEVHEREHSLEVQVPFVQRLFPNARIVPILMGYKSIANIESLARALAEHLPGRNALLVASSDLSHYHPREHASSLDARVIERFDGMDATGLREDLAVGRAEACGGDPIVTLLSMAPELGATRASTLDYADSGRVNGDLSSVVGYLAAVLETVDEPPETGPRGFAGSAELPRLTEDEKRRLLAIAREAVSEAVCQGPETRSFASLSGALAEPRGAFVTIRRKGRLRGCVGFDAPRHPLGESVRLAAGLAAVNDNRFKRITRDELGSLTIEISILGPLHPATPGEIVIGRHGLVVSDGHRRGLLLPQVAVEQAWTPVRFLEETCGKAGLPANAWDTGARIEIFETVTIAGDA